LAALPVRLGGAVRHHRDNQAVSTSETTSLAIFIRRFRIPVVLIVGVGVFGVVGYMILLGWSFRDAAFMTVVTLSTIGYQEVRPLGVGGQAFTTLLIVLGLVSVFALLAASTELIASGELERTVRRTRVKREIGGLYDHFVVCGYGRVGRAATEEFRKQGLPIVVIDINPESGEDLDDARIPHLIADATREATLLQAGIARARGLVCAVDSVALNVYITLSARAVRDDLTIVARATDLESIDRLYRAGANRVIQPYAVSGRMLAAVSVRPAVIDFMDLIAISPDLRLEELEVRKGGTLDGIMVREVPARFRGVVILAVRSGASTVMQPAPDPEVMLHSGDVVVALGPVAALGELAR
jgi:voltage-gated potassium channel